MNKLVVVAIAALMLTACVTPASATIVEAVAFGDDLAGASLMVTFQFAGAAAGIIGPGPGAMEGSLTMPGFFKFSVIGDTHDNLWNLTNLTDEDYIIRAVFMLQPGSISLFDNDTSISTPNSFTGKFGAVNKAGVPHGASGEFIPWPDASNMGDMYEAEFLEWANFIFFPGASSSWMDDTDIIPEPSTLLLIGLAGLALRRKCRAE